MSDNKTIASKIDDLDYDIYVLSGLMRTMHIILNDYHYDNSNESKALNALAVSIDHAIERCENHSNDIHKISIKEAA